MQPLNAAAFPPANAVLIGRQQFRGTPCGLRPTVDTLPCLRNTAKDAGPPREPLTIWMNRPISTTDNPYIDQTYRYGSTMGGFFQQHQGVEFNNPDGTPVMAALGGTVVYAGPAEEGALTVSIRHDSTVTADGKRYRLYSTYYHNSSLAVKVGRQGSHRTGHLPSRQHRTRDQRSPAFRAGDLADRLDRRDRRFPPALSALHHEPRALAPAAPQHRDHRGAGVRRLGRAGSARPASTASSSASRRRRRSRTPRPTASMAIRIRSTESTSR